MLMLKRSCPVNYDLCNQTVTVYHRNGQDDYTRTVYTRAFLDFKKTVAVDKTGSKEANSFLLVIPGDTQAVFAGDKVLTGRGPGISSDKDWAAFIPTKVPGLVVVSYVDTKCWNDKIVHTEAGG